ncbi:cupin domain-containing protein [Methanothermobacter sp.]|uniref:cupin domain-containing protein n=1 Tax=Methanothermobacter sp. TaxID=1884223 RepID=UPI003C73E2DC
MVYLNVKNPDGREYERVLDATLLSGILHPKNDPVGMNFSLAHALLREGEASPPHRQRGSVEVHYILEGEAIMQIDDEARVVKVGDAVYTSVQYIENIGKLLSFLVHYFSMVER